jgi:hypothetical protein
MAAIPQDIARAVDFRIVVRRVMAKALAVVTGSACFGVFCYSYYKDTARPAVSDE